MICFFPILAMSTSQKPTEQKTIDPDALLVAIKACLLDNASIRSSAAANGIQKSTLDRYLKKIKGNFVDISSVADDNLLEFIGISSNKLPQNMVCLFFSVFSPPLKSSFSSVVFSSNDLSLYFARCSLSARKKISLIIFPSA